MRRGTVAVGGISLAILVGALWGTNAIIATSGLGGGSVTAHTPAPRVNPYEAGLAAFERGDLVVALQEWAKVADTDARAQVGLGNALLRGGPGVEANPRLALGWYYRAAAVMNVDAEMALGRMFADGILGQADFSSAGFWYRNAGMHGAADGAFLAGTFLEAGRGTRADPVEAATWFTLAASLGHAGGAGARDRVFAGLNASQRAMYEQRVREFDAQRRTGDATVVGSAPT